ncbi:hypothetical protein D3C87_1385500 [compost metagenome]
MRLWRCFIATEHILHREAVRQADRLQRDMRQLASIARKNAQAITTPSQFTHQFDGAHGRFRTQRQVPLMLQQPRMFGRRFIGRQRGEVSENVVFSRDRQRHANGREVMHGDGQGAVHVEHPMAHVGEAHAQSLR